MDPEILCRVCISPKLLQNRRFDAARIGEGELHFRVLLCVHDGSEGNTKVGCGTPEVYTEATMSVYEHCDERRSSACLSNRGAMAEACPQVKTHGSSRGSRCRGLSESSH